MLFPSTRLSIVSSFVAADAVVNSTKPYTLRCDGSPHRRTLLTEPHWSRKCRRSRSDSTGSTLDTYTVRERHSCTCSSCLWQSRQKTLSHVWHRTRPRALHVAQYCLRTAALVLLLDAVAVVVVAPVVATVAGVVDDDGAVTVVGASGFGATTVLTGGPLLSLVGVAVGVWCCTCCDWACGCGRFMRSNLQSSMSSSLPSGSTVRPRSFDSVCWMNVALTSMASWRRDTNTQSPCKTLRVSVMSCETTASSTRSGSDGIAPSSCISATSVMALWMCPVSESGSSSVSRASRTTGHTIDGTATTTDANAAGAGKVLG
eukprot:PhM_4_TR4174/c1_g1_i1/m.78416